MTASSLFDWIIYRRMFDTERIARIFFEQGTAEAWVEVEKAVARAQAQLDIIPTAAATAIDNRLCA